MRDSSALTLLTMLVAATPAVGQEPLPLVEADVSLADFGVTSVADVRHGRVAFVHAPEGARLVVHFLRSSPPPGARPPDAAPEPPVPAPPRGALRTEPLEALWVWRTEQLLGDPAERAAFLSLVERRGIDRVFLYVPPAEGEAASAGFVPFDGGRVGPLVADLRARGALTYALDGDPAYVWPENRAGVLRTVGRIVAHNRSAPPEQRFHGVRYDVEPYLLPGFQGPRRDEILSAYAGMVADVAAAAHDGGLAFGVDIPFWLDLADEITGEPFEAVLDGVRAPVLTHVLDLVDDVAIMAYRTFSEGPDGVLAHSWGELARATPRDVGVFVGVETAPLPDEELYTLRGRGRRGLPTESDTPWIVAQELEAGRARFWLVTGPEARARLARMVGSDEARLTYWFAGEPVELPGSRLSFHRLGADAMERVTSELLQGFEGRAAFRGLAYHDYWSLKALLTER